MLAKESNHSGNKALSQLQGAEQDMQVRVLSISEGAVRPRHSSPRFTGRCKTIAWPYPVDSAEDEIHEQANPDLGCFRGIRNALLLQLGAGLVCFGIWLVFHLPSLH